MHEFAEEYVANLTPREERYDTRLGDDFYVGTFPNGVKTWLYVYEVNGYTRRQTLGVYPEMPLPQALETLYAARRTRAVENQLAEQGLDGARVVRENSPINLTEPLAARKPRKLLPGRSFLAGAGTGAALTAVAAIAVVWLWRPQLASEALPAALPQAQAAALPARVRDRAPHAVEATGGQHAAVTASKATLVATPAGSVAGGHDQDGAVAPAATAAPGPAEPQAVPAGRSQRALIELQRDLTGTLAWAQLTSGIVRGEPVDNLGWIVEVGDRPQRVFYFVRVRGMAGGQVSYRWMYEGDIVKEDDVKVGDGWHSPAYSSVTLTPARLGRWRVEVLGPGDTELGVEEFETRRGSELTLSQR